MNEGELINATNDIRERLQETARAVTTILPPHTGFILLAYDVGAGGRLEYVSNSNREDAVRAMREFITKSESSWMEHQSDKNRVTEVALEDGRDYITHEDVSEAIKRSDEYTVRMNVLEVIGKQTTFGAEDAGLCAFIAWRGRKSE